MPYQVLNMIGTIFLVMCGVFFLLSVVLFFFFKIISVIGDLTGSTARRQIEKVRNTNIRSGDKAYKPSPVNMERGKLTERVNKSDKLKKTGEIATAHPSKRLDKRQTGQTGIGQAADTGSGEALETDVLADATDLLSTATDVLSESEITETLSDSTDVLSEPETNVTTLLTDEGANATTVLSDEADNATTLLSEPTDLLIDGQPAPVGYFKIIKSVVVIHTDEVIA